MSLSSEHSRELIRIGQKEGVLTPPIRLPAEMSSLVLGTDPGTHRLRSPAQRFPLSLEALKRNKELTGWALSADFKKPGLVGFGFGDEMYMVIALTPCNARLTGSPNIRVQERMTRYVRERDGEIDFIPSSRLFTI